MRKGKKRKRAGGAIGHSRSLGHSRSPALSLCPFVVCVGVFQKRGIFPKKLKKISYEPRRKFLQPQIVKKSLTKMVGIRKNFLQK